jgi:hypothetical protein
MELAGFRQGVHALGRLGCRVVRLGVGCLYRGMDPTGA